jgi:hypothetical protein
LLVDGGGHVRPHPSIERTLQPVVNPAATEPAAVESSDSVNGHVEVVVNAGEVVIESRGPGFGFGIALTADFAEDVADWIYDAVDEIRAAQQEPTPADPTA